MKDGKLNKSIVAREAKQSRRRTCPLHLQKHFARLLLCAVVLSVAAIAPLAFVSERRSSWQESSLRRNDTGAVKLGLQLRRLQTIASVLHTGAHPDDEDSSLIATLARGEGARVAYLSLTRGEGGQNRIDAELSETLGVIRTEELLQARALDGGDQLFTRAFDFGFTKTIDEARAKWNERLLLADMVRAIRLHRPLVIVSRFTGTSADGHGQHQLSGRLTPLAFRLAADPAQFPEQINEGLRAWQARKLYVSNFRRPANARRTNTLNSDAAGDAKILRVNTGRYDPLLGRSYYEIAANGRSQHKSQEMGALELRGEQTSEIRLIENLVQAEAPERSVFDGIDVSVKGIAQLAGLRELASVTAIALIAHDAELALKNFNALDPRACFSAFDLGLRHTRDARRILQISGESTEARSEADFLLELKEREFVEALRIAYGVRLDVLADTETIAPGESFTVTMRLFTSDDVRPEVKELRLRAPEGWQVERIEEQPKNEDAFGRRETAQASASFRVTAPARAPVTQPYWLKQSREGDLFRWAAGDAPRGAPFDAPLITGEARIAAGESFSVTQKAQYRYADAVRGEARRDVNVVPTLAVELSPDLIIAPTATRNSARRIVVRLTSNSQREIGGTVELQLPAGWKSQPPQTSFNLKAKGARASLVFETIIPAQTPNGGYKLAAIATTTDGRRFNETERVIEYPHINTHRIYTRAETTVRVFDFKVARLRVGYIMGSGDEVPEAIRRMNLEVTLLGEDELSTGDLNNLFDAIVVGVRASQVRSDFVSNNNRLLDFARAGGTLIVQYQRPDYTARGLAPFPALIGGTNARTTDENAPVVILQPAHRVFHFPNEITKEDWQGWVQERSLYNFTSFDPRYTALLESHDAGDKSQTGGAVYAPLGRGHYIYTSYSWFRQLPAGVPGAYRLFANMLSLSKAPPKSLRAVH